MFKRDQQVDEVVTIIGPSVQVEGEFVAGGDVVIEGIVSGSVKTERNLRVGEQAKLFADVMAANAIIAGEIQGNLIIRESVELTNTAKVFGDIQATYINISSGAVLQGRLQAGTAQRSAYERIDEREKQLAKQKTTESSVATEAKPALGR
jgi:cytoskeletal protein CcmA (bactofilin family)